MSRFYHQHGNYLVKEYIYYFMYKNGLSKRKFCQKCGIKRKVLRQIERQDRNLGVKELLDVFNFINIPHKYMFISLDKKENEK